MKRRHAHSRKRNSVSALTVRNYLGQVRRIPRRNSKEGEEATQPTAALRSEEIVPAQPRCCQVWFSEIVASAEDTWPI
jgi:hypothetical protein